MAHVLPEIVTHTYDPARGAFLNICNLSKAVAETILRGINASGKRTIKANYLERRLATEQWLLSERTRKLGAPVLTRPGILNPHTKVQHLSYRSRPSPSRSALPYDCGRGEAQAKSRDNFGSHSD